ncbi:beta-lactamase/transpeptidase-like protein [Cercophora newfieldiana]|uniref:Beta-lactamase/transpeptidase-like protein n=1 Tax=Cercophora newfieldiana TaxID=92897 RepID=A0AA39Y8J9_9PEZI|nr:beta-lactamase/transpeptidase-like protein [Cercophora newfieldiana]
MWLSRCLAILQVVGPALGCHPEGPPVPRPRNLKQSETLQDALSGLATTLDDALAGKIKAGFDIRNVSFSIGIASYDEPASDPLIWEYHHLSPSNFNGTKSIDRHSQYLIGSISKAITDTLLLRSGINYDDPITKYLPSLANKASLTSWEDITLGSLAGQVAGIVPNYGFSEFYYLKDYFEYLGFPLLTNSSYPPCGVNAMDTGGCDKEELLQGMLVADPVAPPQTRPVYSNIAFTLLAYAVEVFTGKKYSQLIRELTVALNMTSTRPSPGNDSLAVVPSVPNNWGSDYGDGVAGGGLVSTVADLSSYMHAILNRSPELSTPTKIRAWLKPHTFTGATGFQGSPWEIFRPNPALLFPKSYNASSHSGGHTVTITGKDGVAYNYRSRISLLDSYGLGLTILTAGDQSALPILFNAVIGTLVPAVDATALKQATSAYAGTYIQTATSSSNISATATIAMDGPSLRLTNLTLNGKDIIFGLNEIWKYSLSPLLAAEMAKTTGIYRIYPAEIYRESILPNGKKVVEEDWRFEWGLEENYEVETDLPGKGISEGECKSWKLVDWLYYGGQSVDRIVFVKDERGEVIGVEVPFLRTGVLERVRG